MLRFEFGISHLQFEREEVLSINQILWLTIYVDEYNSPP